MQSQIIQEITRILHDHLLIDTTYFTPDTVLTEQGGMGSLDKIELLAKVESHFNVSYLSDDIHDLHTIRDIAERVEAKIGHK